MSRLGFLFLAMVLATSTWSCTDYPGLLEIEHLPDEYDLSDGIYGRLWLNPNPIRGSPLAAHRPKSCSNRRQCTGGTFLGPNVQKK